MRLTSARQHYDLLITEGNDPVHDPAPLRQYMDKWDGEAFLSLLCLTREKTVLEIGVGSGRLAIRTAPDCQAFCGIDLSPKSIEAARQNLSHLENIHLICDDFCTAPFLFTFDVVYSSLTFMHIQEKSLAIKKVSGLLNPGGRFVLSIDKNQNKLLECGNRRIAVYPDTPQEISTHITNADLDIIYRGETEFAYLFAAEKPAQPA